MSVAIVTTVPCGPLDESHHHVVVAAHERSRKIRRAAAMACFNGWMTAFFAACSAPFAPFSLADCLVAVGLSVVAYNEFRGCKRLKQFDRGAAALLGWNQIGFLALIVGYCGWMLLTGLTGEGHFAAELKAKPELGVALDSVGELDQLYRMLTALIYGMIIVLSGIFQGLTALYYFTRRKYIDLYVTQTPQWVLDLQRLTAGN